MEEQVRFFAPKIEKYLPYEQKNIVHGPFRIDCASICWWFKDLCLAPKSKTNNELHITDRKKNDNY